MLMHLRAFAEALFSTAEGPPPATRLDWLMREMEDYLAVAGTLGKFSFLAALYAVSFLAPFFGRHLPMLHSLSVGDRVVSLTKMEESFLAAPVLAVKAFMSVVYYEHPDVQIEVRHTGHATFPAKVQP